MSQSIKFGPCEKTVLLSNASAVGPGGTFETPGGGRFTVQASGTTSSGSGLASIKIEGSNNGTTWHPLVTIDLILGTTQTSDGEAIDAPWAYIQANVISISGTGATVSVVVAA